MGVIGIKQTTKEHVGPGVGRARATRKRAYHDEQRTKLAALAAKQETALKVVKTIKTQALGVKKADSKPKTTKPELHPRYKEALAVKRAGPRGKGRQISDDELLAWIEKARNERPDVPPLHQVEIAYWLEGIAIGRHRFLAAWNASVGKKAPTTMAKTSSA